MEILFTEYISKSFKWLFLCLNYSGLNIIAFGVGHLRQPGKFGGILDIESKKLSVQFIMTFSFRFLSCLRNTEEFVR